MSELINKKTLEHLAELARIELKPEEEGKMLKDLGEILDYFKELQKVDTNGVKSMSGGTDLKSIVREDEDFGKDIRGKGPEAFPEKENGCLKVPPVF